MIDYTCAGGGFGQSKITVLTPRSVRIETQGIADHAPFNYVVQAQRRRRLPGPLSARLTKPFYRQVRCRIWHAFLPIGRKPG